NDRFLKDRVSFDEVTNDIGFATDTTTGAINFSQTVSLVHSWIDSWDRGYLFDKLKFFKTHSCDLIISDISPQAFVLAKKLDLPSIAISNFTWFDIYNYPNANQEDLNRIWASYRETSLGLLLPFNIKTAIFPSLLEVNLVSRKITRSKREMLTQLDIDPSSSTLYAGTGLSMQNPFDQHWLDLLEDYSFILGGQLSFNHPQSRTIPADDSETQDYIACSDVALIKLGYSSVSEAIRAKVPIIGIDFTETTETKAIRTELEELGVAICLSSEEYFRGEWIQHLDRLDDLRDNYHSIPSKYSKFGEDQVAAIILDLLEEIA
ncbi:MAG: hypothetical protein ACTSPV_14950, partial [Candidatus Hodarchaeales archaeon]